MFFIFNIISMIFALILSGLVANAQEVNTGSIRITSTSEAVLGKETANSFAEHLDIDEEVTWNVFVPENYDPANPPGVLLFQFYGSEVDDPNGWQTAMEERNMVLIRIIGKGGEYPRYKELFISVMAPLVLQQRYKINTRRIYTSSVRVCNNVGAIAQLYPNIFKGAIYINCNPSTWRDEEPELVHLMRENRYYFIAGRDRTTQIDNSQELRTYRDAGIENVKFVRSGRLNRSQNLNRGMLVEAIDYLDGKETE